MCDFKEQGEADRALIVKQNAALAADMQKAIIVAIQDGEAKTYRLVRMFLYQDVVFIQNLSRNEPVSPPIPARYCRIWLELRPSPVTAIKTRGRPGPGQGPAWSCIYCKRLAPLPSTSTGRPGQQAVQVAGVHPKAPPDLPQAPGHPPGYGI